MRDNQPTRTHVLQFGIELLQQDTLEIIPVLDVEGRFCSCTVAFRSFSNTKMFSEVIEMGMPR
ncbi:MAG TPA: hypothetical protein VN112_05015 [Ensifer sp.]|nr:hypothetical protein [Ensifer sp.]